MSTMEHGALDYAIFEHPQNGHRERVSRLGHLWALLFGPFYFVIKGAWKHVGILLLVFAFGFIFGDTGSLIIMITWLGYAVAAPWVVADNYRRRGWHEIPKGTTK